MDQPSTDTSLSAAQLRLEKIAIEEELVQKDVLERQLEIRQQRLNAVLELKTNSEAALAKLQGQNERNLLKAQKLEEKKQAEASELLNQGKNPYEVFRRRTIEKRKKKKLQTQKSKIKSEEMKIADRTLHEDARIRSKEAKERVHKGYVDAYQNELGRKAKEDRIKAYMLEKTTSHTELVDPTGRMFRIQPSQVTTIKDHSFGEGKSSTKDQAQRNQVIDMIKSKKEHKSVTADPRFIPKSKIKSAADREVTDHHANNQDSDSLDPSTRIPGAKTIEQAQPSADRASSQELKKGFGKPKRSKLEEKMFVEALKRQKDNILEKQVVWGKEFRGRAFLSSPESLVFKDFKINEPMTIKFQLTNVSNTFNQFKLLSLPDRIKDFFEINYNKPGRMSAGMTCDLQITFCPKINADIHDELPFVAKTGAFSIPLICLTRKTLPVISSRKIHFSNVVMGETVKSTVIITNDGALETNFEIKEVDENGQIIGRSSLDATLENEKADVEVNNQLSSEEELIQYADSYYEVKRDPSVDIVQHTQQGKLPSYGSSSVTFTFSPVQCAPIFRRYSVIFNGEYACESIFIELKAEVIQVPIFVENRMLDFRCTTYDKLYRSKLLLRNRGKVALKCQVQIPPQLQGCIEFLPNFGYVQGNVDHPSTLKTPASGESTPGRFEVQIKFRPNRKLLEQCKSFLVKGSSHDSVIIAVPICISVPQQVLPVHFILRTEICSSDIEFSVNRLNFGSCFVNQAIFTDLSIRNACRLALKFGFVKLGPQVEIRPNDGFGILLPGEEKKIEVAFRPLSAVEYNFNLQCRTSLNRSFTIPCHGTGVLPPVTFSETIVRMGAIPFGELVSHSIHVRNDSDKPQCLEFGIPEAVKEEFRIRPQVIDFLEVGSSKRIEIEYSPTSKDCRGTSEESEVISGGNEEDDPASESMTEKEDKEEQQPVDPDLLQCSFAVTEVRPGITTTQHNPEEVADESIAESEATEEYPAIEAESLSVHKRWTIPCFAQPVSSGKHQNSIVPRLLCLQVYTTCIEKEWGVDQKRLEFGQIALGQVKVAKLQVHNESSFDIDLKLGCLNAIGPFSVLNAARSVPPMGGIRNLFVQFCPTNQAIFNEILSIESSRGCVNVKLVGEGVSPTLSIEPENGIIDLSNVLVGENRSQQFSLHNSSEFPLHYNIKSINQVTSNYNNSPVFSCVPKEGVIVAGGTQAVEAIFSPDHSRNGNFINHFRVCVPNQTQDHTITLRGRSWERQSYVLLADDQAKLSSDEDSYDFIEDQLELPPSFSNATDLVPFPKLRRRRIFVEFPKSASDEASEKHLIIGSLSLEPEKAGSACSFELMPSSSDEAHSKLFSIEPTKGTVNPGQDHQITITYTASNSSGTPREPKEGELNVGQWVESKWDCILKGGYVSERCTRSEETIHVILRAYVRVY